jgi:two-component system, OmpR family, response regulator VicR
MAKGDILIAEDDAVLRSLYEKKFSVEGYEVRTAQDGEQALAEIRKQKPDLLICDIHMPKVDGFQVLKEFPRDKRDFPIIMLTNFDQGDFKLRAQELGADDYFVKKDMTIRSLVEMVEKLRSL